MSQMTPLKTIGTLVSAIFRQFAVALDFLILHYKAFRGIFQQSDCVGLQMNIQALQEWSDKWLLCFHPEKCKAMRIGKSRIEKMDYHQWSMQNQRKI